MNDILGNNVSVGDTVCHSFLNSNKRPALRFGVVRKISQNRIRVRWQILGAPSDAGSYNSDVQKNYMILNSEQIDDIGAYQATAGLSSRGSR